MIGRIAMLAAAVLGVATVPAAAADLYGYGGDRPPVADGRGDLGPWSYGPRYGEDGGGSAHRRAPGPVVFDERGGFERRGAFVAEGSPDVPPPPRVHRRQDPFWPGPRGFEAGYGGFRPGPYDRLAAMPFGSAFGEGYGIPEGGCTVERARSITPAGWEKVVTHRTCYRR